MKGLFSLSFQVSNHLLAYPAALGQWKQSTWYRPGGWLCLGIKEEGGEWGPTIHFRVMLPLSLKTVLPYERLRVWPRLWPKEEFKYRSTAQTNLIKTCSSFPLKNVLYCSETQKPNLMFTWNYRISYKCPKKSWATLWPCGSLWKENTD
jgi:hypothetical protein